MKILKTGLNHVHGYLFVPSVSDEHNHSLAGETSLGIAYCESHVHSYKGATSRNDGHIHYYSGITGPAVYLADGSHMHSHSGSTTLAHHHEHNYTGTDYSSN